MKNKFISIRTGRLLLRQITQEDIENIFKGLSNPDVIKYYGVNYESLEATKEQMNWFSQIEKKVQVFGVLSVPVTIKLFMGLAD